MRKRGLDGGEFASALTFYLVGVQYLTINMYLCIDNQCHL